MTKLPAGLPSELLYRRPDIQQAEQNLVAANADIGAARGILPAPVADVVDRLPQPGAGQPVRRRPARELRAAGHAADLPGRPAAFELNLAEVRKSSAVVEYERSIQTAFREVADGLAGRETFSRQIDAQTKVVKSAERRTDLVNLRYRAGIEDRLELLDSQRQLYAARQTLLDLRNAELGNAVALYKALGGGLTDTDVPPANSVAKLSNGPSPIRSRRLKAR